MPPPKRPAVPAVTASEVCQRFEPSDDARQALDGEVPADAFVARLAERGLYADAVAFLAHWLPKREAVWWGCLCIWKVARPEPAEKEAAALQAAVRWVLDPSEPNRRTAEAAGQAAKADTPEACVATVVFNSGGSISAPNLPEVAPPPFLTSQIVTAALRAAALRDQPENQSRALRLFVQLGQEVAVGGNHWEAV